MCIPVRLLWDRISHIRVKIGRRLGFVAAAELLGQLLLQDLERADDGVGLKDGVSRDRFQHGQPPQGYLNPPRCGGPAACPVETSDPGF